MVERALETTRLRREVRQFRTSAARPYSLQRIVGASAPVTALRHLVARVAISPSSTVLLTGESGTGKDLVAKIIHYASDRAARPFMTSPVGVAGAVAGKRAVRARARRLHGCPHAEEGPAGNGRRRHGVPRRPRRNDAGAPGQLLRFLEEKTFKRVGGATDIHVDVRVIAASNRISSKKSASRSSAPISTTGSTCCPSRCRRCASHADDIPLLVEHFIDGFNTRVPEEGAGRDPGGVRGAPAVRLAGQRPRTAQRPRARHAALGSRLPRREGLLGAVPPGDGRRRVRAPGQGGRFSSNWSAACSFRRSSGAAGIKRAPARSSD